MTTSGANLLLSEANQKFINSKDKQMRVGPTFKLKLYYMFTASGDQNLLRFEIEGKKKRKTKSLFMSWF